MAREVGRYSGRPLPAMRRPDSRDNSRRDDSVLPVPERVPASPMASDRSSPAQSRGFAVPHSKVLEALTLIEEWMNGDFSHRPPCNANPCSCGLWGLQKYLGLPKT